MTKSANTTKSNRIKNYFFGNLPEQLDGHKGLTVIYKAIRCITGIIKLPFYLISKPSKWLWSSFTVLNKALAVDTRMRHVREALLWLLAMGAVGIVVQIDSLIASLFVYEQLTNAAMAQTNVDATFYVQQATNVGMINNLLVAGFIAVAVYVAIKRVKVFRAETKRLKELS